MRTGIEHSKAKPQVACRMKHGSRRRNDVRSPGGSQRGSLKHTRHKRKSIKTHQEAYAQSGRFANHNQPLVLGSRAKRVARKAQCSDRWMRIEE